MDCSLNFFLDELEKQLDKSLPTSSSTMDVDDLFGGPISPDPEDDDDSSPPQPETSTVGIPQPEISPIDEDDLFGGPIGPDPDVDSSAVQADTSSPGTPQQQQHDSRIGTDTRTEPSMVPLEDLIERDEDDDYICYSPDAVLSDEDDEPEQHFEPHSPPPPTQRFRQPSPPPIQRFEQPHTPATATRIQPQSPPAAEATTTRKRKLESSKDEKKTPKKLPRLALVKRQMEKALPGGSASLWGSRSKTNTRRRPQQPVYLPPNRHVWRHKIAHVLALRPGRYVLTDGHRTHARQDEKTWSDALSGDLMSMKMYISTLFCADTETYALLKKLQRESWMATHPIRTIPVVRLETKRDLGECPSCRQKECCVFLAIKGGIQRMVEYEIDVPDHLPAR